MKLATILLVVAIFVPGCTITEVSQVQTGIFGNDLQKLSEAYEKLDKMDRGKTKKSDVEEMGFDLRASNVERVPGPAAFRRIFNDSAFQGALADPKNAETLLREMQQYKAYFIPYRNITTYTDRYYFSTKETLRQGDDLLIMVLFKNDALFYCDYRYVKIDSKESTSAFAQGVIDIIKEFLGPADALYDLADKVKNRGKDD